MSIFEQYYSAESFQDRFFIDSEGSIDVIIPVVHTNELWRKNLYSIYREIPVRRLLISDGGCKDDSIEVVKKFPRVTVFDHREYLSLGYCLRKLIESVETDWFAYLHSDVYLPTGWFNAMRRHQDNYDWFGCPQRITSMLEHYNVDTMSGIRRPYAGSQMGRKQAFLKEIVKIEDDYVYRQEDLVLLDIIERQGFRHGFVEDTFHYHQVMHKESPWMRKLISVKVSVEWSREEEIRAAKMQVKGIIKYLRPSLGLAIEVETQLLRLIQLQDTNLKDFMIWTKTTNPDWVVWIKPWRIHLLSIIMATRPLIRQIYSLIRRV